MKKWKVGFSRGSRRIDGLSEQEKFDTTLTEHCHKIAERPSLSIKFPGDDDVNRTREAEELYALRNGTVRSRVLCLEDPLASCIEKRVALQVDPLVVCRNPCLADEHGVLLFCGVSRKRSDRLDLRNGLLRQCSATGL